jgi:hypothetical protein
MWARRLLALLFAQPHGVHQDFFEVCTVTLVNTRPTLVLLQWGQVGKGLFSYSVIVMSTEKSF